MSQENKSGTNKIGIYQFVLFIMVFFYGLKQIEVFSNNVIIDFWDKGVQIVGCLCLIYLIVNKKYKMKWFLNMIICILIILIGIYFSHGTSWLRYFLLILAARDVKFSKILKTLFTAFLIVFGISTLLFLVDVSGSGIFRRNAISMGFIHPNTAAMIFIALIFLYIANKNKINRNRLVFMYISIIPLYGLLKTRSATLVLLIFPFVYFIIVSACNKEKQKVKVLLCLTQPIVCGISYLMVELYPLPIFDKYRTAIDVAFSCRPYLNFNNISKYGVSLFGQNVTIYNTSDYAFNYYMDMMSNTKYNTVDNAYILGLIVNGVIPMLLMFICFALVIQKAWDNKNYIVMTVAVLFSLYGFIENSCNEAYYFFTFFYLLAKDDMLPGEEYVIYRKEKRRIAK